MSGVIAMIAPLVVFLAVGWIAALIAAPLMPAFPAAVVYLLGSRICHQIAERSFYLADAQLPVCARCTGIYAGLAAGAMYAIFATLSRRVPGSDPGGKSIHGDSRLRRVRGVLAIGALPTLVTVLVEWMGLWQTSNLTRAIAGAALGIAVGLVVIAALAPRAGLHYGECAPRPPIARDRPPSHI
jgi:uncharacterized membrane protein